MFYFLIYENMKYIEMHCHSTLSDGKNTPEQVVAEAERLELEFLALTDHDTIAPQDFQVELQKAWVQTCDSVEISARNTDLDKSLHLVSYAKIFSESLHDVLEHSREGKMKMKWGQFDKLTQQFGFIWNRDGFDVFMRSQWRQPQTSNKYDMSNYLMSFADNKEKTQHILWKLCSSKDVVLHFYLECLKREWALYDIYWYETEEYEPSVEAVIQEAVIKADWIVSMAHPNVTFWWNKWGIPEFERTIWDYVHKGVRWIEINAIAPYDWVEAILAVQKQHNLILTFWSDCHNIWKTDEKHSTIWRINPFIETQIYKENFWRFRNEVWI